MWWLARVLETGHVTQLKWLPLDGDMLVDLVLLGVASASKTAGLLMIISWVCKVISNN